MNTLTLQNVYYLQKKNQGRRYKNFMCMLMCIAFIQNETEVHMNWIRLYHTFKFLITLLIYSLSIYSLYRFVHSRRYMFQ